MIETECQALVQHAVEAAGGRALRFNNRFLVGVCDLLIQLPTHGARRALNTMILEVKLINLSPRTVNHSWDVGCTQRQMDFLRDWRNAGMLTGVVSFVQRHGEGLKSLSMALYEYRLIAEGAYSRAPSEGPPLHWQVRLDQHKELGTKATRYHNIVEQLTNFARWSE